MKHKILNFSTGDYHRKLQTSVLLLFIFCLTYVFVPYIVADANATTNEVYGNITWSLISLSLNTGGDVDFGTITPSVNNGTNLGTMVVAKKNVKISSNGKSARVYLSANSTTENWLSLDGSSTLTIPAVNGTWDSPAAFTGKGFGFAVPDKTVSGSTIYSTPFAADTAFDSDFDLADNTISAQLQSGDEGHGYKKQTWAALPLKGGEKKVYDVSLTGAATLDSDSNRNNFDVYYAVMADETLISGTYSNAVVYTALAANTSLTEVSNNMSVTNASSNGINIATKRFANAGDTLRLKFDFAADAGLVTAANTKVYLVPHSTVASANYTLTDAIKNATSSYPTCLIGSNSDISVSTDGVAGTTIDCTISDGTTSGTVAPTVADNTATDVAGFYDVWAKVTVNGQDINYLSKYEPTSETYAPAVVFAGLQSKYNNDYLVKTMQDMTAQVCNLTNKWGTGNGANARVYDYTGTGNPLASSAAGSAAKNVGTFLLSDTRDSKTYLVRRLADGNCWMVQNLDYDLTVAANRVLSPTTSNVSADKTLQSRTQSELNTQIGYACEEQFQNMNHFGNVSGKSCIWGANVNGTATNNAAAGFARSYNNGLGYITGTSNTSDPTGCATIAGDSAQWDAKCAMGGRIDNIGTPSASSPYNGTTQDSTWQPELVSNSTGDTYTMRGSMYYGDYYNWYAATAESGKFNMGSNANATDSICPRGWRLPVNGGSDTDKSWQHLISGTYGYNVVNGEVKNGYFASNRAALNKMMQLPLSVPFAGYYEWTNGALSNRGYFGLYWSSSATSTGEGTYAYYLNMNYGGRLNSQSSNDKVYGLTVRCVAE